jgi:CRP-like cAMP-binding protein
MKMEKERNDTAGFQPCPAFRRNFSDTLSDSELTDFRDASVTFRFKAGQTIVTKDEPHQGLFCIQEGFVKYFLHSPEGDNVSLAIRKAGDIFGHMELFGNSSIFSVGCLTDATVCFFSRKAVLKKMDRIPAFSRRILYLLNSDMHELGEYIVNMNFKTVKSRTAGVLAMLQEITGVNDDGFIALQLSRRELADLAGTTRESLFRELANLKKKKLISINDHRIKIEDLEKLKKLSQFQLRQ